MAGETRLARQCLARFPGIWVCVGPTNQVRGLEFGRNQSSFPTFSKVAILPSTLRTRSIWICAPSFSAGRRIKAYFTPSSPDSGRGFSDCLENPTTDGTCGGLLVTIVIRTSSPSTKKVVQAESCPCSIFASGC